MTADLPGLLVLTDRTRTGRRPLLDVLDEAIAGGARAILVREKDLSRAERAALVDEVRARLAPVGGVVLIASDPLIVADGLHLASADPLPPVAARPPLLGRSCHTVDEARAAEQEGCDYVTLSPVFATASKPGYGPVFGVAGLRAAVHELTIPVFGLGGITASNAGSVLSAGARGLAVMGGIMAAAEPTVATAALVAHQGFVR